MTVRHDRPAPGAHLHQKAWERSLGGPPEARSISPPPPPPVVPLSLLNLASICPVVLRSVLNLASICPGVPQSVFNLPRSPSEEESGPSRDNKANKDKGQIEAGLRTDCGSQGGQ